LLCKERLRLDLQILQRFDHRVAPVSKRLLGLLPPRLHLVGHAPLDEVLRVLDELREDVPLGPCWRHSRVGCEPLETSSEVVAALAAGEELCHLPLLLIPQLLAALGEFVG